MDDFETDRSLPEGIHPDDLCKLCNKRAVEHHIWGTCGYGGDTFKSSGTRASPDEAQKAQRRLDIDRIAVLDERIAEIQEEQSRLRKRSGLTPQLVDYGDYCDPRVLPKAKERLVRTTPTKTALQWHERMTKAERETGELRAEVEKAARAAMDGKTMSVDWAYRMQNRFGVTFP